MGGSGTVCVTTCVCGVAVRMIRFVVTTRRTRFTGLRATCRLRTTFLVQQFCTVCAFARGTSATCIAPVPMIAPPHVQAQSFARAIRTDIGFSLFSRCRCPQRCRRHRLRLSLRAKGQCFVNTAIALTAFACPRAGKWDRNQL
jgi:hypothetical protein